MAKVGSVELVSISPRRHLVSMWKKGRCIATVILPFTRDLGLKLNSLSIYIYVKRLKRYSQRFKRCPSLHGLLLRVCDIAIENRTECYRSPVSSSAGGRTRQSGSSVCNRSCTSMRSRTTFVHPWSLHCSRGCGQTRGQEALPVFAPRAANQSSLLVSQAW